MILAEPPPTGADLHFRLAGFPVRVHPFFWAAGLLLGLSGSDGEPIRTLLWVVVLFVSILIHELGHALLQRKFGGRPKIVLHGFGGLAICGDCDRSPRSQILISLAGPGAGFLFAAVVLVVVAATSGYLTFVPVWQGDAWVADVDRELLRELTGVNLLLGDVVFQRFDSEGINMLVLGLLSVNIFWGLVNLLPIYPLDGGQISRELFTLGRNPQQGIIRSLQVSIAAAAAIVAVWGLAGLHEWFIALFFGYLAYMSYRNLQAYTGGGPGLGWR